MELKDLLLKDYTNDNVEQKFLHEINPKQIVSRFSKIPFMFYEVRYKYTTMRGNKKEGIRRSV